MEYRSLGSTGLEVSALCLGTMQFGWTADEATSFAVLDAAFEAGINFIDTADIYSRWVPGNPGGVAESILGRWLAAHPGRRENLLLATKVRGPLPDSPDDQGLSRAHILKAAEASLRRLGTPVIDLYQTHWPDADTPIAETLEALDGLVQRGWVRFLGCSNYPAQDLLQALSTSDRERRARFECLQPHYNLMHRQEFELELEDVCRAHHLGVIPYSPLAGGFLTGKYLPGEPAPAGSRASQSARIKGYLQAPRAARLLNTLGEVARAHDATPSQVALAWLLQRPTVTSPIIGPRSLDQLADNLGAVGLRLNGEESAALEAVSRRHEGEA